MFCGCQFHLFSFLKDGTLLGSPAGLKLPTILPLCLVSIYGGQLTDSQLSVSQRSMTMVELLYLYDFDINAI